MFHSLKSKFLALCLGSLCVLGIAIGAVSLTALTRSTNREEIDNMNRTAELYRSDLDMKLLQTENVVSFAATGLQNGFIEAADKAQRAVLSAQIDSVMRETLLSLPEARAYYTYYAPELTGGDADGVWYVREDEHSAFRRRQWYQAAEFLPEEAQAEQRWSGAAVIAGHWSDPHYSVAQGMVFLSYVVPVYRGGALIGIVGADLDFAAILRSLDQRQVYETGTAFLVDASGKIHYHIDAPEGVGDDHAGARLIERDTSHGAVPESDALMRYQMDGVTYDIAACPLRNGMGMRVIAPTHEVQREAHAAVQKFLLILLLCLALSAVVTLLVTKRITRHLQSLDIAAHEIARGNLDVKIAVESQDEVGGLARALQKTVRSLKETLARLHRLTFHDGLTGILNRLGLDRALEAWHAKAAGAPAVLISLDLDDFKFINDLLGHAAGDEALRALARRLHDFFSKDALVARNGGDEFTVLLPDTTAEQAEQKLTELTQRPQHYTFNGREQSFTLSIGYASYPDQAESLRELTRCADAALYATKLKGKNGFSRYTGEPEQVSRAKLSFSLRDISQNLPGAILVARAEDQKILYANDEMFRLLGCRDFDDFLTYTQGDATHIVYLGDRQETGAAVRAQTAKGDARQAHIRHRIRTKDGEIKFVRCFTRKRESAYYGEVYYTVLVEEKDDD